MGFCNRRWDLPSKTMTPVSRKMRNVVKRTRMEKMYVQMGSANFNSGCEITKLYQTS